MRDRLTGRMRDPLSNKIVCFLCDFRCRCFARADCPYGLVGNGHLRPVLDRVLNCIQLYLEDVVSVAGLPLLEVLAYTYNRSDPLLLAPVQLLRYDLVCLLEMLSPLTVTDECPHHPEILNLIGLDLSCLSSLVCSGYILHAHLNM